MSDQPGVDCGHRCCDDRRNPFHGHFLDPEDCSGCQWFEREEAKKRHPSNRKEAK